MEQRCTNHFDSLIACILLAFCHCVTAGSFVSPPENVTVYSGQMAMFTCQVTQRGQDGIYWRVTEERIYSSRLQDFYQARSWDSEDIDDDYTSSRGLEMIGTSETDNTSVECVAYYLNPDSYILSDRVYLRVQGILDAPSNLASTVANDTSVLITWDPPSTLPGTTMNFTINASMGDHSETFTTSQHNFLIGLCDLGVSSCYSNCEVSVSVRSVNQAGEGEQASITVPIQPFSCAGNDDISTQTQSPPTVPTEDLMPYLIVAIASGVTVVLLIVVAASVGACIWMTRGSKRDYDSKPPSIETGKNPSYGDAPSLIRNPCYEEAPHVYEPIGPIYNTVGEVAIGPHPKGVASLMYPAHENA